MMTNQSLKRKYSSKKLEESIIELGLLQFDVKDDGDCLFHSLEFLFNIMERNEGTALDIRKKVVDFIIHNDEIFNYVTIMGGYDEIRYVGLRKIPKNGTEFLREELEQISHPKTFEVPVFDLFPVIIATLFQIELKIYPWQSKDPNDDGINENIAESYIPLNRNTEFLPAIKLLYVDGIHYKPMIHNNEITPTGKKNETNFPSVKPKKESTTQKKRRRRTKY
jgi:hypothetical protein